MAAENEKISKELTLDSVRDSLTRQEDSIVFALIERASFPLNPKVYVPSKGWGLSFAEFFVREAEALQSKALSRRIHYGRHVAEVKFREKPQEYSSLIRAQDSDALMKLLTVETVEEMVKRRVAKKSMVFGQTVTLEDNASNATTGGDEGKYKVDPSLVSRLYADWVMPLTKVVEVEYLLRRLD